MTSLPSYVEPDGLAAARTEIAFNTGAASEFGCKAVYKEGGAGDGVLVDVAVVEQVGRWPRVPGTPQGQQATMGQRVFTLTVQAMTPGETATLGVGSGGGISRVKAGDTFTIHGPVIGLVSEQVLRVAVGTRPQVSGGAWIAEVTL